MTPTVKLNAKEIVKDIRQGLDNESLSTKHGLTPQQLAKVFDKLVQKNLIEASELLERGSQPKRHETSASPSPSSRPRQDTRHKTSQSNSPQEGEEIKSCLGFSVASAVWLLLMGLLTVRLFSRTVSTKFPVACLL